MLVFADAGLTNKFANKVVGVGKRDSCCELCRGNHDGYEPELLCMKCSELDHSDAVVILTPALCTRLGTFSSASEWEPYDGEQPTYNVLGAGYLAGQMGGDVITKAGEPPSTGRLTLARSNENFRNYGAGKQAKY